MKFKPDENLPAVIAADLRAVGHEADTVAGQGLTGAGDATLMARLRTEDRVILRMDKGLGDVRAYAPDQFGGIVIVHPRTTGPAQPWPSYASISGRCCGLTSPGIG